MLDWGIDNPFQAALIQIDLEDHEWDEIAQVVLQMEGPNEIPHNNLEIINKLMKVESVNCQVGTSNEDLKELKHDGSCLRDWSCVGSKSEWKEGINTRFQVLDMAPEDESTITTISKDPCGDENLVATPITREVSGERMLGTNSNMGLEREGTYSDFAITSTTNAESRTGIRSTTSLASSSMDTESSLEAVFHLPSKVNKCVPKSMEEQVLASDDHNVEPTRKDNLSTADVIHSNAHDTTRHENNATSVFHFSTQDQSGIQERKWGRRKS
ncbi:hypothetical protein Cgig2_023049 [Carnegiea gigantea]|uniref:Uncharacterized protein n=1 Tax=Carnegiea gigantea TaxID=171969 RepID=A0A9Q1JXJ9_9CARY|nr:hypothetical protein Cgig2_023049 [Carnegiea gigantea]